LEIDMLSRRGFLFGAGATLAVIRTPGLLMPVKAIEPVYLLDIESQESWYSLPPGTYTGRWTSVLAQTNFDEIERRILALTFQTDDGVNLQHKIRV
jgi:hypothetical protein